MTTKPDQIITLEKFYNITLTQVEEDIYFKWDFKNTYILDSNGKITALNLKYNNEIKDISILKDFKDVTQLYLQLNQISDLSALSGLMGLTALGLEYNQISDLGALSGLTGLTALWLEYNQISDLRALSDLKGLKKLWLENNQISDLSALSGLMGLTELYLNGNQISDLGALSGLKGLTVLRLSENQITDLSALSGLTGLTDLRLYSNQITDLSALSGLTGLTELNLSNNQINDLRALSGLTGLTVLGLGNNQISDLSDLSDLKGLKKLWLENNQISDLSALSGLMGLTELYLNGNQISDLSALSGLTGLTQLRLRNNQISDLRPIIEHPNFKEYRFDENTLLYPPKEIVNKGVNAILHWQEDIKGRVKKKISKNKEEKNPYLDLGNCSIVNLNSIPELFECLHLETLILSNYYAEFHNGEWHEMPSNNEMPPNNIGLIPKEIRNLINLKNLIIGGDWKKNDVWNRGNIRDISSLQNLPNLEYLNISNNQIEKITNLAKLPQLKVLHANNNKIKTIYRIPKSSNLEELYISNNQLNNVNFLTDLENLKAVDLHSNNIKDLSLIYNLIQKIGIVDGKWKTDSISVANNPLTNPGIEVVQLGTEAVLSQLSENREANKTFKNNDIKLIFIGNSEVGKTTIANYLNGNVVLEQYPYTLWMDEFEFTKGIFEGRKVHAFDFGGHDYYHDTHHIFFSNNALYILLWDKNTNVLQKRKVNQMDDENKEITSQVWDYPLRYWIESVAYYTKEKEATNLNFETNNASSYNSQLLIVQNKVSKYNEILFLNNRKLKEDYPFISNFVQMDVHHKVNLDFIKSNIVEMLDNAIILGIGASYPYYYKKIKDSFLKYEGKTIINREEFYHFCKQSYPYLEKRYIENLARYFEYIGLIILNKDASIIVMNKKSLTKEIAKIFNKLQEQNGHFTHDDIEKKQIQNKEEILSFMKEFKMIFELYKREDIILNMYDSGHNLTKNKTIIKNALTSVFVSPLYLPEEPNSIINLLINKNQLPCRRFSYSGFIHKYVILNIFSEYSSKIPVEDSNSYYWRNGLIIKEGDGLLLIKFFMGNEEGGANIDIFKLNEHVTDEFFNTILDYIKHINQGYTFQEKVTINGVDFVKIQDIYQAEDEGFSTIIDKENGKEYKLYDFKNYLKNKKNNKNMKKIFISYSHKDTEYLKDLFDFLSPLERMNKIEKWTDLQLKSGVNTKTEILNNLNDADIVILLISQKFIASNFIQDHELPLAIKKKKDNNGEVILISLDQSTIFDLEIEVINSNGNKEMIKMSDFYFIPQDSNNNLKPILYWEDKKAEAWKKVYDDIKSKL